MDGECTSVAEFGFGESLAVEVLTRRAFEVQLLLERQDIHGLSH